MPYNRSFFRKMCPAIWYKCNSSLLHPPGSLLCRRYPANICAVNLDCAVTLNWCRYPGILPLPCAIAVTLSRYPAQRCRYPESQIPLPFLVDFVEMPLPCLSQNIQQALIHLNGHQSPCSWIHKIPITNDFI